MNPSSWRISVDRDGARAIDLLAEQSGLPRQRLKDAMAKGAVWLKRGRHEQRLRRAIKALLRGDQLSLHYDAEVLARTAPAGILVADDRDYSVWFKPALLLAQGTPQGDHCSLLRQVELQLAPRPAFLVHRLDREAQGLMIIAHSQRAASALSTLWQENRVRKHYQVTVEGVVGEPGSSGTMDQPLDGKGARSDYVVIDVDPTLRRSRLEISLITGRKHQIRRHCAALGAPVVGDYRYGRGGEPLALTAVNLAFCCPLRRIERNYDLPEALRFAQPPRAARSDG